MRLEKRCSNMNHARHVSMVMFCPTCGEKLMLADNRKRCESDQHAARRKNRDTFCIDCGIALNVH